MGRVLLYDIQGWITLLLGGLLALITLFTSYSHVHPPSSAPSPSISKGCFDKSAYYSSLPWFRRLLAMLNWRPVVDYELREIEFEKRKIAHEQRM